MTGDFGSVADVVGARDYCRITKNGRLLTGACLRLT